MPAMSRSSLVLTLVLCSSAWCCDASPKPSTDAVPSKSPASTANSEPSKSEPITAEPTKADPILLKVCQAFDEVSAEGKAEQANMRMASAAVRATKLGVTEAQLGELGAQPQQLLASIRKRGNPPECAAFVAYLEALP